MDANETVKQIRERLVRFRGRYFELSQEFGLDYSWLSKFANGHITNPTVKSLEELHQALSQWENDKETAA